MKYTSIISTDQAAIFFTLPDAARELLHRQTPTPVSIMFIITVFFGVEDDLPGVVVYGDIHCSQPGADERPHRLLVRAFQIRVGVIDTNNQQRGREAPVIHHMGQPLKAVIAGRGLFTRPGQYAANLIVYLLVGFSQTLSA